MTDTIQSWWTSLPRPACESDIAPLHLEWTSEGIQMGIHTVDNGYVRLRYFSRDHCMHGPWVVTRDDTLLVTGMFVDGDAVGLWIVYQCHWHSILEFAGSWQQCYALPEALTPSDRAMAFNMMANELSGQCIMYQSGTPTEIGQFVNSRLNGEYLCRTALGCSMQEYQCGVQHGLSHSWSNTPQSLGLVHYGRTIGPYVVWADSIYIYWYRDTVYRIDAFTKAGYLYRRSYYHNDYMYRTITSIDGHIAVDGDLVRLQIGVSQDVHIHIDPIGLDNTVENFIQDCYNTGILQHTIASILESWTQLWSHAQIR